MKGDTKVGTLIVLDFAGLPVNQAALEAGATGMATRQGGTLSWKTIDGWPVAIIKGPTDTTALLRLHNNLVAVVGEQPSQPGASRDLGGRREQVGLKSARPRSAGGRG